MSQSTAALHQRTALADRLSPFIGYFVYSKAGEKISCRDRDNMSKDDTSIGELSKKECRYPNFMSQEEIQRRREIKLNPFTGYHHYAPGKYSALHPLFPRSKESDSSRLNKISSYDENQEIFFQIHGAEVGAKIVENYYSQRKFETVRIDDSSEMLGSGSFSTVLRGNFITSGREVAIKCFNRLPEHRCNQLEREEELTKIQNEINLHKKLKSKNIVQFIDYLVNYDKVFLIMELCEAGDLETMLYLRRKLTGDETKLIAAQLFNALQFIHKLGYLHGDVKPANIMFQTRDRYRNCSSGNDLHRSPSGLVLKLCDFGASRFVHRASSSVVDTLSASKKETSRAFCAMAKMTPPSSSSILPPLELPSQSTEPRAFGFIEFENIGTEGYLSPEHLRSEPLSRAIDSWAAGVILYKCVTGYLPYRPSAVCLRDEALSFSDQFWMDINEDCRLFVQRCLYKDPLLRLTAEQGLNDVFLSDVWL